MPTYWNGLGNELGNGLGQFATGLIQTKNSLEQQALDRRQQEQELQMRQQAAELQRQQYETGRADIDYNRQRQQRLDGISDRESDFKTVLAPQMDTFMEGVNNDIARYAPTLKDGSANPQYSPALYQAATTRKKQAIKLLSNAALGVGHGENWEASKTNLLQFIGGEAAPAGQTGQNVKSDPAQTPPQQMTVQGNDGASASFTVPGQPAPAITQTADQQQAAPATEQQPARDVTNLSGAELLDMTDDQLAQQYGQGGLEWGRAKRAAYVQQVQAQQAEAAKIRAKSWDTQLGELSKRTDLTGDQRLAMATISSLMARPQLSEGEAKQMADAFTLLTPKMYDATSWQKVLDSKDPAVILAQLPVYQKYAPDVVQGFDPAPFQQAVNDAHDLNAAKVVTEGAQAGNYAASANKTNVEADAITQKLPGEIANTAADTREKNANADKTVADAAGNRQKEVSGLLAAFGSFPQDMTYEQILQQAGPAVQKIKDVLGIDDAGVANLIGQAQYKYSLGIKGEQLKNQLAQAKVSTQVEQTGLIQTQKAATAQRVVNDTAATNSTIAVNQTRAQANAAQAAANLAQAQQTAALTNPKVAQIQAGIQNTQTRTAVTAGQGAANIALTNARTGLTQAQTASTDTRTRVAAAQGAANINLTQARTGQVQAQTAVSWANIAKIKSSIQTDQQRTAAYVTGVKGKYVVDMAHAANLNSQTALNRAKNPNDPLYNPVVAASKPGDPVDALKKKAGLYYTQADGALKTANTLQSQINTLVRQGTGGSGNFRVENLSTADQDKLKKLTAQRDKLMQVAVNRRNTGDGIIANGLNAMTQKVSPAPKPQGSASAAVPTQATTKPPAAQRPQLQAGGQPLPRTTPSGPADSKVRPIKDSNSATLPLLPQYKNGNAKAASVYMQSLINGIRSNNPAQIQDAGQKLYSFGYTNEQIQDFARAAQKGMK